MNQYELVGIIGKGTYGTVYRAKMKRTGDVVAIKKLNEKFDTTKKCMELPEVKTLIKTHHANIVKLKEVIRSKGVLHLVFESMDCSLFEYTQRSKVPMPEARVRNLMYQIIQALEYLHVRRNVIHRDLKPENLLMLGETTIKLADFGLSRDLNEEGPLTHYVSTRWYRAPEIILHCPHYTPAVDMWALACIMAELLMGKPLFPGESEIDMLLQFNRVLGPMTEETWPEGYRKCFAMFQLPPSKRPTNLTHWLKGCSAEAVQLITDLLHWNPEMRPNAREALKYPFFELPLSTLPGMFLRPKTPEGVPLNLRRKRNYSMMYYDDLYNSDNFTEAEVHSEGTPRSLACDEELADENDSLKDDGSSPQRQKTFHYTRVALEPTRLFD